jgi:hypothetical protein
VNRSSPAKNDEVASIGQIRALSEMLGTSHAWKSTHDYVLHTLNRQARDAGLNTVPERRGPLSPVHVTNLRKEHDSPHLAYPIGQPITHGPVAKITEQSGPSSGSGRLPTNISKMPEFKVERTDKLENFKGAVSVPIPASNEGSAYSQFGPRSGTGLSLKLFVKMQLGKCLETDL